MVSLNVRRLSTETCTLDLFFSAHLHTALLNLRNEHLIFHVTLLSIDYTEGAGNGY